MVSRFASRKRTNSPPSATAASVNRLADTNAMPTSSCIAPSMIGIVARVHRIAPMPHMRYPVSASPPSDAPNSTRMTRLNNGDDWRRSYSISSARAS